MLSAHTTTRRASEEAVLAVPTPIWTDTWHPVSHYDVVHSLQRAVANTGLDIIHKEYSLNQLGTKMFGSWSLSLGNGKIGYELGIRNAVDRSLALGVCAGTRVFVCDNMCFSADFIAFRKHTGGLDLDELEGLAQRAVADAVAKMHSLHSWQVSLKERYIPRQDFKALAYDCMTSGVFSSGNLDRFLEAHAEEQKSAGWTWDAENMATLYTVHGAATRVMRGWNLIKVARSTAALEGVLSRYIEAESA